MKKVLIYENRKTAPVLWDASTPELMAAAKLELFQLLHRDWECYVDLLEENKGDGGRDWPRQRKYFLGALNGDKASAAALLDARRDNEYEEWSIAEVLEPNQ